MSLPGVTLARVEVRPTGEIIGIHLMVAAGVDIYASTGVTDGGGSFGYLVYVRESQFDQAADALGL